ncbi:hypothetical protein DH09_08455 [Bacillaceae bacterium JMAK1]|nr:hypothetical protein DH09_08455 [Bacillaceae bacterium JMAK1]
MTKVFISYDYDEDANYKRLLTAWSKNESDYFKGISFDDGSTDISINSHDEAAIRRAISRRLNTCDKIIVLIGKDTHKSKWCRWEIEKAAELGLKFVAVKLESSNTTPTELYGKSATWAHSFTKDSIEKAINSA